MEVEWNDWSLIVHKTGKYLYLLSSFQRLLIQIYERGMKGGGGGSEAAGVRLARGVCTNTVLLTPVAKNQNGFFGETFKGII